MRIHSDPKGTLKNMAGRTRLTPSLAVESFLFLSLSASFFPKFFPRCRRHLPLASWFHPSVAQHVLPAGRVGIDSGAGARYNPNGAVHLSRFLESPPNCISETRWAAVDKTRLCVPDASLFLRVCLHVFGFCPGTYTRGPRYRTWNGLKTKKRTGRRGKKTPKP